MEKFRREDVEGSKAERIAVLTVKQLLLAAGLDVPEDRIKLVRHVDRVERTIRQMTVDGDFELFQSEQVASVMPFHNCDVIASFIGLEGNKAEFHGVYRIKGHRPLTQSDWDRMPEWIRISSRENRDGIFYDLEEIERLRSYRGRLIVQWKSTRGWHQKKDLDIYEILPATVATLFPGYQEILLRYDELQAIFTDPRAHRDWKAALKANAGIYRIVDLSTGKIYIGSAYGSGGIWARWENYARTGHGSNKLLKDCDPNNFQWSIVRTLSTTLSPRDVIRIESLEKRKHGSRAIGLNGN
jgi:hypothetical protein